MKRFFIIDSHQVDVICKSDSETVALYYTKYFNHQYSWWRRFLRWIGGIK